MRFEIQTLDRKIITLLCDVNHARMPCGMPFAPKKAGAGVCNCLQAGIYGTTVTTRRLAEGSRCSLPRRNSWRSRNCAALELHLRIRRVAVVSVRLAVEVLSGRNNLLNSRGLVYDHGLNGGVGSRGRFTGLSIQGGRLKTQYILHAVQSCALGNNIFGGG